MCVWNMKLMLDGLVHDMLIGLQNMIEAKRQIIALERQPRVVQLWQLILVTWFNVSWDHTKHTKSKIKMKSK